MSLPLVAIAALAFPATAAAYEEFPGTRVLGMGGASRAFAVGDAGPMLNPSGMSLMKTYNVEGAYGYGSRLNDHSFHASAVDNTSAFGIAGGLYYTYHLAEPPVAAGVMPLSGSGHAAGVALSIPFTSFAAIGGTVKYLRLEGADAPGGNAGGVTFDLGATVRPHQMVSLALVGRNLRDLHNSHAPVGIAYGAALLPIPGLILVADGITHFTADNLSGRKGTSVDGGRRVHVRRQGRPARRRRLRRVHRQRLRVGGGIPGFRGRRPGRRPPAGHLRGRRRARASPSSASACASSSRRARPNPNSDPEHYGGAGV